MKFAETGEYIRLGCQPLSVSSFDADLLRSKKPEYQQRLDQYFLLPLYQPYGEIRVLPPETGQLDTTQGIGIYTTLPEITDIYRQFSDNDSPWTVAICGYEIADGFDLQGEYIGKGLHIKQFQAANFPKKPSKLSVERSLNFFNYEHAFVLYLEQYAYWLEDRFKLGVDFISIDLTKHRHNLLVANMARSLVLDADRDVEFIDYQNADQILMQKRAAEFQPLGYNIPITAKAELARNAVAKPVIEVNPIKAVQQSFNRL